MTLEKNKDSRDESRARFFPTTGGILKTMDCTAAGYTYLAIDGVENCMAALRDIEEGKLHKCFIEMSACVGSCVGGPVMEKYHRSPVRSYIAVSEYAGKDDFDVQQPSPADTEKHFEYIERKLKMPTEEEITEILRQMGKTKPSDELNCGSCGYDSCRAKAVAIYQGKAEISMCLPYLKERRRIFRTTSSTIRRTAFLCLNENLEVQQINRAALSIMNIPRASDVHGRAGRQDPGSEDFYRCQRYRPQNLRAACLSCRI